MTTSEVATTTTTTPSRARGQMLVSLKNNATKATRQRFVLAILFLLIIVICSLGDQRHSGNTLIQAFRHLLNINLGVASAQLLQPVQPASILSKLLSAWIPQNELNGHQWNPLFPLNNLAHPSAASSTTTLRPNVVANGGQKENGTEARVTTSTTRQPHALSSTTSRPGQNVARYTVKPTSSQTSGAGTYPRPPTNKTTTTTTTTTTGSPKVKVTTTRAVKIGSSTTTRAAILFVGNQTTHTPSTLPQTQRPSPGPIKDIEDALKVDGVQCGRVPIYEKTLKRSFNSTQFHEKEAGDFRILYGMDSVYGEWPWIVRIQECSDESKPCTTCTGTLLSSRWLITAGHCGFNRSTPDKFKATLGLYDLISPEKTAVNMRIDKIIVHPDYNDLTNDITLMKMSEPVKFNDFIQPACLIHATRNVLEFTKSKYSFTVGYGLIEGMASAARLQKLQIQSKQPSECNSDKLGSVQLRRGTMCIGPMKGKKGGSCKGDSGGPDLVYDPAENRWYVFATVSYGPSDCDREDDESWLTVSVDLSNYRTWILQTVLQHGAN